MAGGLLRSGSVKDFYPLGAVGNPVYSAASQLRAAMRRQLGQELADLFAIPKQDERGDTIDWYAAFAGNVVPWSAATPEERAPAKTTLLAAREQLVARSQTLQAVNDSEQQVFGKLLALTMQIPSEEHVYLVDGRPVITFWGFTERDAPPNRDVISGLDTGTTRPAAAVEPVLSPALLESTPALAPESSLTKPAQPRRWLWWWLLLLLLLPLLWFGLRACSTDERLYGWQWFGDYFKGLGWSGAPAPAVEIPGGEKTLETGPIGQEYKDRDSSYRGESSVETQGEFRYQETPVPGTEINEQGIPSPRPDLPAKEQKGTLPDLETKDQRVPPSAKGQGEPPASLPPQRMLGATDSNRGSPLVIPPHAQEQGSTAFLDGQWRSITGLQDESGNPVQLQYRFKDGQGSATLVRAAGGREQTCTAPARSTMKGGKLFIEGQANIVCPDGTAFGRPVVECATDPSGHAICLGKNENGSNYGVKIVKD